MTGISGCGIIDNIDPSSLPSISIPSRPTESAVPVPTETVTNDPEPQPTVTEDPEPAQTVTAEPSPEPSPTSDADADGSSVTWWPWVLIAVILLIVIIVLTRRSSARKAWMDRLHKAKSELSWVEDSLIPQVLSKPTAAEAQSLWQAARPRILDLDRELHELGDSAPSEAGTASTVQGLQALQGLTSTIDAETSTHDVTDADALRARRAAVESARAQARAWITPPQR